MCHLVITDYHTVWVTFSAGPHVSSLSLNVSQYSIFVEGSYALLAGPIKTAQ